MVLYIGQSTNIVLQFIGAIVKFFDGYSIIFEMCSGALINRNIIFCCYLIKSSFVNLKTHFKHWLTIIAEWESLIGDCFDISVEITKSF